MAQLDAEFLVLLSSGSAQRMVVTWPKVVEKLGSPSVTFTPGESGLDDEFVAVWAHLSGVAEPDIEEHFPVLWANEILGADGEVAPTAINYVRVLMVQALEGKRK